VVVLPDRKQIGPRLDSVLWDEFVDWVEERHGSVRGVLGEELEIAIRQRMDTDDREVEAADIHRIDARLERIEQAVDVAQSDGGVDSRSGDPHTHTKCADPHEKPHAKAPRENKIRWLASRVYEEYDCDAGTPPRMLPKSEIVDLVVEKYSFGSEVCEEHVDGVIDYLGYIEHRELDNMLVDPKQLEESNGGDES
jgi:hypothetical protein